MSDSSCQDKLVQDLTSAVHQLSLAARTLSQHVTAPSSASPVVPDGWEIVEEETAPYPALAESVLRSELFRGVEEGPVDTPPACLDLAKRRLTSVSIGAEARAHRAFRAGFWARAAIQTHTEYRSEAPLRDLKVSHWVVLSCNKEPSSFRVCSRSAFDKLTEGADVVVCEKFASIAEVQIFCLGAQAPVPQLLSCKK